MTGPAAGMRGDRVPDSEKGEKPENSVRKAGPEGLSPLSTFPVSGTAETPDSPILTGAAQPTPMQAHLAAVLAYRRPQTPKPLRKPRPRRPDPGAGLAVPDASTPEPNLTTYECTTLRRPPSWVDSAQRPEPGTVCSCCTGYRWWTERETPKGWQCIRCHPPDHLPAGNIVERHT